MKVCVISPFPPEKDGVGNYVYVLSKKMLRINKKLMIYVIARKNPLVEKMELKNLVVLRLWNMSNLLFILKSTREIIKHITLIKPNIVHIHYGTTRDYGLSAGEPFLFILAFVRYVLRKKTVMSLHGFWTYKETQQIVAELTGNNFLGKVYSAYYQLFSRLILRVPSVLVNVVMDTNSPLSNTLGQISKRRDIVEICHGIFKAKNRINKSKAKKTIGCRHKFVALVFGFIRRGKGYENILYALQHLFVVAPDLKKKIVLIIAGAALSQENENYAKKLEGLVQDLDIKENVKFKIAFLTEGEISIYLSAADVIILAYNRRGGPSGVLAKALPYEIPVIITKDEKYIDYNSNFPAIVIKNNDINAISRSLIALIENKENRLKLKANIERYKEKYNFDQIANRYLSLYEKILK